MGADRNIKYFLINILIASYKKIKANIDNYQAIYYRKLYKDKFSFSSLPHLGKDFFIDLRQNSKIKFMGTFVARGSFSVLGRDDGKIQLGSNIFFNLGCSISCLESVTIGNDVMFGENVKIYDHNHEYRNKNALISSQGYTIAPVTIGNNCWFGTNVVILKGITIGDNVIVGANVIVNKNIASNQVIYNSQELVNKSL